MSFVSKFFVLSNKPVIRLVFDILLTILFFLVACLFLFVLFYYLRRPQADTAVLLLPTAIVIFIINSLAGFVWKSWKMWAFAFSLFLFTALLLIFASFVLASPYMIANPIYYAATVVVSLILSLSVALWISRKRTFFRRILFIEIVLLGLFALMPLYVICMGKTIVLRTISLDRLEQDSSDYYRDPAYIPTTYEIEMPPANYHLQSNWEKVYVVLNKQQNVWSIKAISKTLPDKNETSDLILKAIVAGRSGGINDQPILQYENFSLPDIQRTLIPESENGKSQPYLVTLTLTSFERPILRNVKYQNTRMNCQE